MAADFSEQLRKASLFSGLDDSSLAQLSLGCRRRQIKAKDSIFHQGDPGGTMVVILDGRVSIERVNDRGVVVQIATRVAGDVIGEFSLFDHEPRNADVRAIEDISILIVDGAHVKECLKSSHALALSVIQNLIAKLREATDRSTSGLSDNVRQRLAKQLLMEIDRSGVQEPKGRVSIPTKLTHQDLASRTGCTRETVSRTLSSFRTERVLATSASPIRVVNLAKLEEIASPPDGDY